eukprot:855178-Prorocentrum_minimum.AAC.1
MYWGSAPAAEALRAGGLRAPRWPSLWSGGSAGGPARKHKQTNKREKQNSSVVKKRQGLDKGLVTADSSRLRRFSG